MPCSSADGARRRQAAFALHQVPQVLAGHELHHEIRGAVRQRAVVEHRHDRRMLQARHDLRLAPEARARVRIGEQVGAHDLDRDRALEPQIPRAKHRAHAALADHRVDAVLAVDHARRPASTIRARRRRGITVGVNVGVLPSPWRGRRGADVWPGGAAATGRAPRPSAPRCRAAARDPPACRVPPIASCRARSTPTNGRGSLPPAKIGTSSATCIAASHRRSGSGTRATGDCSSSRNTSSGLSDQRSSVITPLSAGSGDASTRSVDTGASLPAGLAGRRRHPRRAPRCSPGAAPCRSASRPSRPDRAGRLHTARGPRARRGSRARRTRRGRSADRASAAPRRDSFRPSPSIARKNR